MDARPVPVEGVSASQESERDSQARIGILVVAYNAESTLEATLDRIPHDFRNRVSEIMVCDDASHDATLDASRAWPDRNPATPMTVVRNLKNLGYGGNQKAGYQMAIDRGLDIVVLLHGDGQYAPECLAEMVAPLERGEADAVMGSRMLEPGAARKGGMPLYKYVGNRILTKAENWMLGSHLSEFHSGYRAYNVSALAAAVLAQRGEIIVSTPNFGHWYSRGRVATGHFDYDRRGILDKTHLRFFMRRGLLRMFRSTKLEVQEIRYTGLPLAVLSRPDAVIARIGRPIDRFLVWLRPTLFGYQFVVRLGR